MDASTRWTIISDGAGRDVLSVTELQAQTSPARKPVPAVIGNLAVAIQGIL